MSTLPASNPRRGWKNRSTIWLAAVFLAALVLVVANAHFVYVAVTSQPECVPHLKSPAAGASDAQPLFRAAKSAC